MSPQINDSSVLYFQAEMDEMMDEMQRASGDLSAYQSDLANAQTQKSQLESGMLFSVHDIVVSLKILS